MRRDDDEHERRFAYPIYLVLKVGMQPKSRLRDAELMEQLFSDSSHFAGEDRTARASKSSFGGLVAFRVQHQYRRGVRSTTQTTSSQISRLDKDTARRRNRRSQGP